MTTDDPLKPLLPYLTRVHRPSGAPPPGPLPAGAQRFIEFWTRRPDWRDAAAYPVPIAVQWYGFEFARRQADFPARLRAWVDSLSDEFLAKLDATETSAHSAVQYSYKLFGRRALRHGPYWPAQCITHEGGEWDAEPRTHGRVSLVFDLTESVPRQIARARRTLEAMQQGQVDSGLIEGPRDFRVRAELYPAYLRVLDARDSDPCPSWVEIADALEDGSGITERKVRGWHEAAIELRDQDYLELLSEIRSTNRENP